jgi:hypothetical protein
VIDLAVGFAIMIGEKACQGQRGASFETTELKRLFKQSFLGSDVPEGQY